MAQGHHCGYHWHLRANAMPSGTSRAHTAGLLCRSPSTCSVPPPPLPCCVVLSGCSQPTVSLPPAATPQPPGLSKVRDTWKKVLGNKCKAHCSSLGTSLESRHKAQRGTQRILFTSCPSTELPSEDLHKHVLPIASTWTRDHQQKWPQTKAKCPDKAGPFTRFPGKGHNPQPLHPSQGKGLGEPTLALRSPHLHTSSGDLTSQREALMTWGGGLCVSGPGRVFRLLLSILRAPDRQTTVLPTCGPHGGAHRGQACSEFPGCSVWIRGDLKKLHIQL